MSRQLPTAGFNALVSAPGERLDLGIDFEMLVDPAPCTVGVYYLGAHIARRKSVGGHAAAAARNALPHMHNGLGVAITYQDRGRAPTYFSFDMRAGDALQSAMLPNSQALVDAEATGQVMWHNAVKVRANRGDESWKGPRVENPYWQESRMIFRGVSPSVYHIWLQWCREYSKLYPGYSTAAVVSPVGMQRSHTCADFCINALLQLQEIDPTLSPRGGITSLPRNVARLRVRDALRPEGGGVQCDEVKLWARNIRLWNHRFDSAHDPTQPVSSSSSSSSSPPPGRPEQETKKETEKEKETETEETERFAGVGCVTPDVWEPLVSSFAAAGKKYVTLMWPCTTGGAGGGGGGGGGGGLQQVPVPSKGAKKLAQPDSVGSTRSHFLCLSIEGAGGGSSFEYGYEEEEVPFKFPEMFDLQSVPSSPAGLLIASGGELSAPLGGHIRIDERESAAFVEMQIGHVKLLGGGEGSGGGGEGGRRAKEGSVVLLRHLDISRNSLVTLDAAIVGGHLLTLNLSRNGPGFLEIPPSVLACCTALESLDLSENQIRELPQAQPEGLKNLRCLRLGCNDLSGQVPAWFGVSLQRLEELSLAGNALAGLPTTMRKLTRLSSLSLRDNAWEPALPNGGVFPKATLPMPLPSQHAWLCVCIDAQHGPAPLTTKVQTVYLDESEACFRACSIDEVLFVSGSKGAGCLLLRSIELSNNNIGDSLPFFDLGPVYSTLTELSLRSNRLKAVPLACLHCLSLERLDMGGNQIESLPDGMAALTGLKSLKLANNQLAGEVPEWLGRKLTLLETLCLSNNHLSLLPPQSPGQEKEGQWWARLKSLGVDGLSGNEWQFELPPYHGTARSYIRQCTRLQDVPRLQEEEAAGQSTAERARAERERGAAAHFNSEPDSSPPDPALSRSESTSSSQSIIASLLSMVGLGDEGRSDSMSSSSSVGSVLKTFGHDELTEAFKGCDRDNDGFLTVPELVALLHRSTPSSSQLSVDQIGAMLSDLGIEEEKRGKREGEGEEGIGKVSLADFVAWASPDQESDHAAACTVQPGDSLNAISQRTGVSVCDLVLWNGIVAPSNTIGMDLVQLTESESSTLTGPPLVYPGERLRLNPPAWKHNFSRPYRCTVQSLLERSDASQHTAALLKEGVDSYGALCASTTVELTAVGLNECQVSRLRKQIELEDAVVRSASSPSSPINQARSVAAASAAASSVEAAAAAAAACAPRGIALVMGVGTYPQSSSGGWPDLPRAEAGSLWFGGWAASQGYDVHQMIGAQATKAALEKFFSQTLPSLRDNSRLTASTPVLLWMACHGSRARNGKVMLACADSVVGSEESHLAIQDLVCDTVVNVELGRSCWIFTHACHMDSLPESVRGAGAGGFYYTGSTCTGTEWRELLRTYHSGSQNALLTSVTADQVAEDGRGDCYSLYTEKIKWALEDESDGIFPWLVRNHGRDWATAFEVHNFVCGMMAKIASTPQFGLLPLTSGDNGEGQFIFYGPSFRKQKGSIQ